MCILDTFFCLVSLFISIFLNFFLVYSLNLVLCLHLAINSLLLFNNLSGHLCIKICIFSSKHKFHCYVLTCWPSQKSHSRWRILMAVMRGNRVGGNWLMKWDEVKKIPLYSHRLTHRKRVTSELHDGYFRSMTITQAIPKVPEVTHPGR